jgi:tetrahydromethanopterin S-methyltransferase subunit G
MSDLFENKLVDKRVVHRYVKKGIVDEKEFDQYLKRLPDLTDKAVEVESEIAPSQGDAKE